MDKEIAMTKAVTIDQVMDWQPCEGYSREFVTRLFAGREQLTARDIVALEIPAEDRLWALLHPEFLTDAQMHALACDYAEQVVHLCGDDPRPRAAIEAKRAWLRGEISDGDLAAAWAAAWDAAWAAAGAAARDAAWAAAKAAAWDWQLARLLEVSEAHDEPC